MPKSAKQTNDQLFLEIAKKHFGVETLERRYRDQLDFHDIAVWCMRSALQEAFDAGKKSK
jgi:hypothetical protein